MWSSSRAFRKCYHLKILSSQDLSFGRKVLLALVPLKGMFTRLSSEVAVIEDDLGKWWLHLSVKVFLIIFQNSQQNLWTTSIFPPRCSLFEVLVFEIIAFFTQKFPVGTLVEVLYLQLRMRGGRGFLISYWFVFPVEGRDNNLSSSCSGRFLEISLPVSVTKVFFLCSAQTIFTSD